MRTSQGLTPSTTAMPAAEFSALMRDLFTVLDTDHSGTLGQEELRAFISALARGSEGLGRQESEAIQARRPQHQHPCRLQPHQHPIKTPFSPHAHPTHPSPHVHLPPPLVTLVPTPSATRPQVFVRLLERLVAGRTATPLDEWLAFQFPEGSCSDQQVQVFVRIIREIIEDESAIKGLLSAVKQ